MGCLIAVVSAHRRKSGDVVWQRKRHARRAAERKLAEARKAPRRRDDRWTHFGPIRSALVGLIADMRNIVAEGLTASEADATLARDGRFPPPSGRRCCDCWKRSNRRNTGRESHPRPPAMIETAEGLIPSLARHLERGS